MSSTLAESFVEVPPGRFWAKQRGESWHPLVAHSADVAAVLDRLLADGAPPGERLRRLAGWPELATARPGLVLATALHDLGKSNHGFQTKTRPHGPRNQWRQRGHVTVLLESLSGCVELKKLFRTAVVGALQGGSAATVELLVAAIAHHGRPHRVDHPGTGLGPLWAPAEGRQPLAEMERLISLARGWAGAEGAAWPTVPAPALHLFAGLVMLADWVGSTTEAFPCCPAADDDPEGYWRDEAQPRAAAALAAIGLLPRSTVVSLAGLPLLTGLFPNTFAKHSPTPLQQHVANLPLPEPGARLLIESETGSGKTEAALALYARLRAAGRVAGLFFALPTRATASAMHERVVAALAGMYTGADRPTVALAVGGEQPRSEGAQALAEAGDELSREDSEEARPRDLAQWAAEHPKARLAAEIVVGTVDQALLAALPVKHAHIRLAALSRHLVVVDELHSYDRYMTVLLTRLLDLLGEAGGLSLFMSATLSDASRGAFGGGEPADEETAKARCYPCFAVCPGRGQGWTDTPLDSTTPAKEVAWSAVGLDDALAEALAAAAAGARVLFVRNTIVAARAASAAVVEAGSGSLLWSPDGQRTPAYHSRYAKPDRLALDAAVRRDFGPDAAARPGGCLLLSTQVAEQSLDVDFDLLLTDLCPIDVLLQRIGRLHRHAARQDHRPAVASRARVIVVGPEGGFTDQLERKSIGLGWGDNQPYHDYAHGELTLRQIDSKAAISIPAENRALIEAVYHPAARERLRAEPAWARYWQRSELHAAHERFVATTVALPFGQPYHACAGLYDNELSIDYRTRLGLDTVRLDLPYPVHCWYAAPPAPVLTADLPQWCLPKQDKEQPLTAVTPRPPRDGATSFAVAEHLYWYGPDGWEWES